ncbi:MULTISPECIES: calcium-translocating P-type ATPase, SERCA-type [Brevibacillus]|uniref:calcium-translocating P-type ATPase, SERCA-type n=1 Tax=Brevibacillus TaxID=55080 RepID=UPI0015EF0A93|nr:calcium-translocating P-type ATPase, SERCA-type [Brevibacillus laterosporus]MBA4534863.1 calcium-translocating P-type ATPase, SERCA-type [Brevibacillus halotolerans]MCR8965603.1 calcium-translocating P-type ATPase, SERCA-type [Brevibacillus laterosporus]MCZ0837758.1 calcium-translocating P-type ATPase, SERCA-type [Brevibacillus halotolerans]
MVLKPNKPWYQVPLAEIPRMIGSDVQNGLTQEEAATRRQKYGKNQLAEAEKIPLYVVFMNQFKDFMVGVLVVATILSFFLGEYLDAIAIIAIIFLNGVLGFIQEAKAERSLNALKDMAAPMARVIRNGNLDMIPATLLVPGDLILLEAGDRVPADMRLINANRLEIEESTLTGESIAVMKTANVIESTGAVPLGDQKNLAFMGTMVAGGTGRGIAIEIGMSTEIGKIAHLINQADKIETPLQIKLEQLGKTLVWIALLLTIFVIVAGVWHGQELMTMFLSGVSLAVAAIPEGLPAIVTVALALGVQRMIKRNAIVRKLPSVETLGCASVICSDKTGTLTENKMTVTHLWHSGKSFDVTGNGYEPNGEITWQGKSIKATIDQGLTQICQIAEKCNNAKLVNAQQKERSKLILSKNISTWNVIGDPTEGALLSLAYKALKEGKKQGDPTIRIDELPFDSERKMMSVVEQSPDGKTELLTKGAVEALLMNSSHIYWQGEIIPLTNAHRIEVAKQTEEMASRALRVLGFAYRSLQNYKSGEKSSILETNLTFLGMVGMIDPPRQEVKSAIQLCRQAGIKTVMITGDHKITAEAIGRQIGLMPGGNSHVLEGATIDEMTEEELMQTVEKVYVYARVSPEHKLRIVKALQNCGHIVAMTGDGVNDAPAIKASDIGIAMGITGTDVTKEAASLVLRDDNFTTIVSAVEEGRNIYDNIRKFIRYLLASNVGEILVMFFAMLMGLPLPLLPIQILWVNLVTDGLPAMALGIDPSEGDTMRHKPRKKHENIFARGLGWKIISRGFLIGTMTLGAFIVAYYENPNDLTHAQTVAFATLVLAQLIHVFDCRSEHSVFHRNPFSNKFLVWAVLSSMALVLVVIYWDVMQPIFKTTSLSLRDWALIFVAAGIPTFVAGMGGVFRSSQPKEAYKAN